MKASYILIISLSFSLAAFGQADSLARPDDSVGRGFTNKAEAKNLMVNGLKEEKWVEYYKYSTSGAILTTDTSAPLYHLTIYKSGKPSGIARGYNKNGKIVSELPYLNGKLNGIAKEFHDNGKISMETTYADDKVVGIQRTYYNNGNIKMELSFINGQPNGMRKMYYESGALQFVAVVNNNIWESFKSYYENGKLKSETTYNNGVKGATKSYDENGNEIK